MSDLANVFKALSDGSRLAIFELIRERCPEGCRLTDEELGHRVSDIATHFNLALPTVSHHLKELRNAGLIHCEKRGRWVHCRPNHGMLELIAKYARGTTTSAPIGIEVGDG